jgi:alpha/beta superfamily hydrolase
LITSLHPVLSQEIKTSHILLSYPLGPRAFLTAFNSNTYARKLSDLLRDPRSNVLVIYGDCDEFTSDARYGRWAEEMRKDGREDKLHVVRVEGASHFWGGSSAQELARVVKEWVMLL